MKKFSKICLIIVAVLGGMGLLLGGISALLGGGFGAVSYTHLDVYKRQVYGMYKDAGVSDITYRLYEDDRHEILNETDRDQVMADIAAWLNVHVEL